MPWTRTHLEFPLPKVSIDTVQSERERRRPESPHGPRPPCRHAPERARSTIRKIPGVASGMWPHTVSMRPHARRDAWNFPRGRAPGATPKARHGSYQAIVFLHCKLQSRPFFRTRTTKRKTRNSVASLLFSNCGRGTLGGLQLGEFEP